MALFHLHHRNASSVIRGEYYASYVGAERPRVPTRTSTGRYEGQCARAALGRSRNQAVQPSGRCIAHSGHRGAKGGYRQQSRR
jgi:hypothetical protein